MLSKMTRLGTVDFENNALQYFPVDALKSLVKCEVSMMSCLLAHPSASLSLCSLKALDLASNKLVQLGDLSALTMLNYLNVSNNQVRSPLTRGGLAPLLTGTNVLADFRAPHIDW